jgi:hypothetical protein
MLPDAFAGPFYASFAPVCALKQAGLPHIKKTPVVGTAIARLVSKQINV